MALGLTSSETIDNYWSKNTRRRIFHNFPNGTAPLVGLLSMMDNDETPIPEFGWQEKRWAAIKTTTVAGPATSGNKTGPFTTAGVTTASGDSNGNFDVAAMGAIRLYVTDASDFQVDTVVKLFNMGVSATGPTATSYTDIAGRVTVVGSGYVELELVTAQADLLNVAAAAVGKHIYAMGSAFSEGARSRSGRIKFPNEAVNYTQIFKTAFELTRTALKAPTVYDKTGAYKEACFDNGIDHMSQLELAAFFGERGKTTAVDPSTGDTVSRRFTGGLMWFLQQWEKGSVAAGGAIEYGQADVSAETDWVTYTNKRIIKLAGATITKAEFNELNSRVFERTNATDWSKLCLCGPGYLNRVADMFERQIQFTSLRENGFKGFDFEMIKHNSNAGTVFYKTHPLFNDPAFRNSAFYIDLGYMNFRPLTDSDTDIEAMIQENDADKRKDQWLTEGGFEFPYPEAFQFVGDLGGITL